MRQLRGNAWSDISHISACVHSGTSEAKSQNVSCALDACGMPWCGSGLSACTKSGNFIASCTNATGRLAPTRSKLPSRV